MWDISPVIFVIRVLGKEKEDGTENYWKEEAEHNSNSINLNKSMPRHSTIKILKTKNKENVESRQKDHTLLMKANNENDSKFVIIGMETRRKGNYIFQVLKKRTY